MSEDSVRDIVLAGAGGHAKVVADMIRGSHALNLVGATDPNPDGPQALASGLRILGTDDVLARLLEDGVRCAALGLGLAAGDDVRPRRALRARLEAMGFSLPALIHPRAVDARTAAVGEGAQVMAQAVLNPGCSVGAGAVINTGAIVEHDVRVGADAFVGPAAALGGGAAVGEAAFIGMGAVVLPGVRIGPGALVGAGAVVLEDVPGGATVVGVPARARRKA